jgi:predicted XRE-type DNA-binding protein
MKTAVLLEIKQAELSRLKVGHISQYSVDRLLTFFNRLSQTVEIKIKPSTRTLAAETVLVK